jgi:transcriptional regulator with XRE-family HTH domain
MTTYRRRSETDKFRMALMQLRAKHKWTQETLASKLGVAKRTLSHWECGHWLPPVRQRLHVLLALHDVPPEYVLEVADGLGISADPAAQSFLQQYEDALDPPEPVAPPAPVVVAPPRVPIDPERLRASMDTLVRDAADAMNVSANELRAALGRALATCAELGGTLDEMRDAVAVRAKPAKVVSTHAT